MPTLDGNIVITNAQWCHFKLVEVCSKIHMELHGTTGIFMRLAQTRGLSD